jgi:phasin
MNDTTEMTTAPKALSAPPTAFEMSKFEMSNMEIPAAFRELAEKSVSQAKESYERMKNAAEEATDLLEGTYATATRGAADYGLKVLEAARANTNGAFDFASEFITVRSLSEAVELSTAHARKQFDALSTQAKELAALAQRLTTETVEPVKESFNKAFKKVA